MRRVGVAGYGFTKVGEPWDKNVKELFADAALSAMKNAEASEIDFLYVSNMLGSHLQGQLNMGAMMSESIGKPGLPAIRVEAGQASGGVAFHVAHRAVASGLSDYVMVGGVEKMSDLLPEEVNTTLVGAEEQEYTAYTGITKIGLSAILHRLYMKEHGASAEDIGMFSVRGHDNAVGVQHAQYPFKLSIERVLTSPMEADPIHMMECSAVADGAAAIILCPLEKAITGVEVASSAIATDHMSIATKKNPLFLDAVYKASKKALGLIEFNPTDIDMLEVCDDTTIDGVLSIESLGFVEHGKGAKYIASGSTAKGGEIPTNTFGGLKARGNPVGATGLYQIAELAMQITGKAGTSQVTDVKTGLAQNMSGVGSTCSVTVLRRA